jgi:hypothetical protein
VSLLIDPGNIMTRLDRRHRALPLFLGVITLAAVALLLVWDAAAPGRFPPHAHDILGALPLGLIAIAYLTYEFVRRPAAKELVKATLLALAFLFWAGNQLWPDSHEATLMNDLAIALFVLDVFLVIVGWPASSPDKGFAESPLSGEGKL